jgi:hypothetical protein
MPSKVRIKMQNREFRTLTEKELFALCKSTMCYDFKDGYFTPFRYTRAQIDYMAREEYDWGWRMRAKFDGGINLEFITDGDKISFEYKASCSHERSNTVDTFVSGKLFSSFAIGENLIGKIEISLPERDKGEPVQIYLPCESEFAIKDFKINGTVTKTEDKGEKVLILGDSITQGAGPDHSSMAYANIICREKGFNALKQGVGGYRYEPIDLCMFPLDEFVPDKIIVFLGTNYDDISCFERGYDYEKAVIEYYEKLNKIYGHVPIISITPLWKNRDTDYVRFDWCRSVIARECAKYENIKVVDGFDLVPQSDDFFADGVHPNELGSLTLAKNLLEKMEKIGF